jgi:hypothetical protein
MGFVKRMAQREPAATGTVLSWVAAAACGLFGHPEFAPVLVAVGLMCLGIRTQVTPNVTAQEVTTQAATTAAIEVAKGLTDGTAGAAGEVTGAAAGVVDDALESVAALVGGKK